jgi:hypothetical protein
MSEHQAQPRRLARPALPQLGRGLAGHSRGQALIEYVLIILLVVFALVAVLTITGPAVGNVFSNTVFNLLGGTIVPRETLAADDFWTQVAAVASYTPENPGLFTNTPAPPTLSPTPGPSPTATPVTPTSTPRPTNTPGPSPTPTDAEWGHPFDDLGDNPDRWRRDFGDLITTPWSAEYWNYSTFGWRSNMSAMPDGSGLVRTTIPQLDFYLPSGTRPHPSVNENFYARYKNTYTFENREYTFVIMRNNGVRIWVGGRLVVDANVPNPGDPATWVDWSADQIRETWFERKFTPTAGSQEIVVEFVDPSGSAHLHVFLLDLGDPLATATWSAEYWNYTAWRSDMSTMADGTGVWRTSYPALNLSFASGVRPNAAVSENFYARFKATVLLDYRPYVFRISRDNGVRVWVNGQLAVGLNAPRTGDPETWISSTDTLWFERPFIPAAAGAHNIVVEWVDPSGAAHLFLELAEAVELDRGNCGWALSGESFFSPPEAWSDSPGRFYDPGSYCILNLRGTIDLRGATNPRLEFYDRYSLQTGTFARVGIREVGTIPWVEVNAHFNSTDLTWVRNVYDLTNFGGRDFTDRIIELRFVLDATNSTSALDGWWIDNIKVENYIPRRYTVGFEDNMEGISHWYPGGTWARSNEAARGGSLAWSDSPGGSYQHGTNSTLELDGVIDLTGTIRPEITFWHRFSLANNDVIYAEISTDGGLTWQNLTGATGVPEAGLAYRTTNLSWSQVVIPLSTYVGREVHFRFRLDARSDTSVADGWWIDDFAIREEPSSFIYTPWCDGMEGGGGNWLPGGSWAVVSGLDFNPNQPQTIRARTGSAFWSDSPATNYTHLTNNSLELLPRLNLTGTTNPEIVFWHQWDLAFRDNLHLEVSTDNGGTWTAIWSYLYDTLPSEFCSTCTIVNHGYNQNLSWHRQVVSLRSYAGQIINVRFRLDARSDALVDDGWWLDDICFQEQAHQVRTVGFSDGFEGGAGNWHVGGTWAISSENARRGRAFSDSVGTSYLHGSNAVLELQGVVNLTGTVKPTLYYWEAFNLATEDYTLVEINISDDGGNTWQGWRDVPAVRNRQTTTLSWNRQQVDLRPYIPTAGTPNRVIRIRFRLYAVRFTNVAEGWWIDDVSIVDRQGMEMLHSVPFVEDVERDNDYWVFEGTWNRVPFFRMVGSGSGLDSGGWISPGGWTGFYYADTNANRAIDPGEFRFSRTESEINFNWGTGRPSGLTSNDNYIIRWTRSVYIDEDNTRFYIEARSDDGIRVIVNPPGNPDTDPNYPNGWAWNAQHWAPRGWTDASNPTTGTVTLNQGWHTILVEYFEATGSAQVRVDFGKQGRVFHDSLNSTTNYIHLSNMSTMLEGMIDMRGTIDPALTFWDSRALGSGDWVYVDVSTNEGFSWTTVWSASGTDTTWRQRFINLTSYAGQLINIRFRLDARVNSAVGDGWYVDDIVIAD